MRYSRVLTALGLVLATTGLSAAPAWMVQPATQPTTLAAPVPRPADSPVERWYEISLGGKHAGHQFEEISTKDGRITTKTEVLLVMKRGDADTRSTIESRIVENEKNDVISMWTKSALGGDPVEAEYVFDAEGVTVKRTQYGATRTTRVSRPADGWLSPRAAQKFLAMRQTAGAKEIAVTTIDPAGGLTPSTETYTLLESTSLTAGGKPVKAWKYRVKSTRATEEQTVWLDERAEMIRTETELGVTKLVAMSSTREAALRPAEGTEIMISASVKAKGDASGTAKASTVEYILRLPGGELPELPKTSSQTVTRQDRSTSALEVKRVGEIPAAAADAQDASFLKSTSWVDRDDPEIKALAAKALKGVEDTPAAKAEAIRKFVHRYITNKNFGSGFATASQVARSKAGDCTEHAVLCAAMLRVAGVPSRVASGLVFAREFGKERDVFAYHMWTQAIIEQGGKPRWVELDATLNDEAFNAAHIALAVTSLADGEFETSMAPIAKLLGKLEIEVVKVER